jgi:hypothetical protein
MLSSFYAMPLHTKTLQTTTLPIRVNDTVNAPIDYLEICGKTYQKPNPTPDDPHPIYGLKGKLKTINYDLKSGDVVRESSIDVPELYSLPDGTCDKLVIDRSLKKAWVERNTTKKVIDGTYSSLQMISSGNSYFYKDSLRIGGITGKSNDSAFNIERNVLCDHFTVKSLQECDNSYNYYAVVTLFATLEKSAFSDGIICRDDSYLYAYKSELTSLSNWITWLNANPITCLMSINAMTKESIDYEELSTAQYHTEIYFEPDDDIPYSFNNIEANFSFPQLGLSDASDEAEEDNELNVESLFGEPTGELFSTKFQHYTSGFDGTGEAMNDSVGLTCEPSTNTYAGQDDFAIHRAFFWKHCNFTCNKDGSRNIIAIEGIDDDFSLTGAVNVGTITPALWYGKEEIEDGYYVYHLSDKQYPNSRPDLELTLMPHCIDKSGKPMNYGIVPTYLAGIATVESDNEVDNNAVVCGSSGKCVLINKQNFWHPYLKEAFSDGTTIAGVERNTYLRVFLYIKYRTLYAQDYFQGVIYTSNIGSSTTTENYFTTWYSGFEVGDCITHGTNSSNKYLFLGTSAKENRLHPTLKIIKKEYDGSKYIYYTDNPLKSDYTNIWVDVSKTGATDNILGSDGYAYTPSIYGRPYRIQGVEDGLGVDVAMFGMYMFVNSSNYELSVFNLGRDSNKIFDAQYSSYDEVCEEFSEYKIATIDSRTTSSDYYYDDAIDINTGTPYPVTWTTSTTKKRYPCYGSIGAKYYISEYQSIYTSKNTEKSFTSIGSANALGNGAGFCVS